MPDTAGKKILVVDDNRDAADGTALLLQLNGHTVTVAYDAASALENVASFKPDAALFDIGLPGMNGYELCREIRSLPIGKDMLLIALTGYGQSDNVAMALDAGFDEHLIKPASPEQLNRALQSMHHHPS